MRHLKNGLVVLGLACVAAAPLGGCGDKKETKTEGAAGVTAAAPAKVGEVATAETMPARKPGLWRQSISVQGAPAPLVVKVCLDAATDRQMSVFGSQASKQACPDSKMVRTATGYDVSATCNMGTGGKQVTSGKVTGDYSSRYEVVLNTTVTGASVPQMNQTSTSKVTSEWLGPCPADMLPGDQDLPNGMRINMTGFDPAKAKAIAEAAKKGE